MSCFPRCIQKSSENATADAVYPFVITRRSLLCDGSQSDIDFVWDSRMRDVISWNAFDAIKESTRSILTPPHTYIVSYIARFSDVSLIAVIIWLITFLVLTQLNVLQLVEDSFIIILLITLFFVIAFTVIRCVIIYLSSTRLEHAIAEANANVTSSRDPTLRFVAGDKLDGGYRIRIVKDSSAMCPRFIDVLSRSQMNLEAADIPLIFLIVGLNVNEDIPLAPSHPHSQVRGPSPLSEPPQQQGYVPPQLSARKVAADSNYAQLTD